MEGVGNAMVGNNSIRISPDLEEIFSWMSKRVDKDAVTLDEIFEFEKMVGTYLKIAQESERGVAFSPFFRAEIDMIKMRIFADGCSIGVIEDLRSRKVWA